MSDPSREKPTMKNEPTVSDPEQHGQEAAHTDFMCPESCLCQINNYHRAKDHSGGFNRAQLEQWSVTALCYLEGQHKFIHSPGTAMCTSLRLENQTACRE